MESETIMRKSYFFLVIVSLLLIIGCGKDDNPVNTTNKGIISGKVTDQSSGVAIEGASISTYPTTTNVISNNSGIYAIYDVEAGIYSITVTSNGYVTSTSNVNVIAGQTLVVNIALLPTPVADPLASFNYGGSTVTPANITFTNTSQNANSYLWEFGDGTTSTATNPSKNYNTKGTYIVKLTATNTSTGKSNQTSQNIVITPGKVFLQRVIVDQFPFTNSGGVGWDIGSGPDLFFTIIDSVKNNVYTVGTYYDDLTPSALPVQWVLSPELEFLKSSWNKTFYINLWDYDPLDDDDEIGFTNGFKITQQISANYPTTVSLQNTSGTIKVRLILRWQ
jgi:PKD repeat protein